MERAEGNFGGDVENAGDLVHNLSMNSLNVNLLKNSICLSQQLVLWLLQIKILRKFFLVFSRVLNLQRYLDKRLTSISNS